ncbi:hypothetical protein H4R99_003898 [Coemansia sp. RSA 1722]|nr:hypothetical protein LPJ57_001027 [Coemansia sp. RSA 486]KAJ2233197.1 hypothetical protein IWW45_004380 [Coemansia sp. RSA 485]KAJ2598945.1 hypothetical protein H4R99_003898 [Coemansia sp. RSA 1722]KAJ2601648.1 hypothetical protein GGF39_001128 [Coemansia sp. RSA 1721]KAJ2638944.1 hypothetical protein GGF40_001275 [Coemansia sp. RSA 1286]
MDRREPPPSFSLSNADGFRTPETRHPQRHTLLGEHSTGNRTPATQIAQGAIGRRLDLEGMGQQHRQIPVYPAEHPMASMIQEDVSLSIGDDRHMGAFTTPVHGQFYSELADSPEALVATPSMVGQGEQVGKQNAVDPDFILNLNQEADLERLTKRAVAECAQAWKKETMQALKAQVDGLNEDSWMYS